MFASPEALEGLAKESFNLEVVFQVQSLQILKETSGS
jgi:hypothetical protein